MKIRTGFISNSSTSCFICDTPLTVRQVEKKLKQMVEAYYEIDPEDFMEGYGGYRSVIGDIHRATEEDARLLRGWDSGMSFKKIKGKIIVMGANDNSVPWGLIPSIEKVLNAERWHLG